MSAQDHTENHPESGAENLGDGMQRPADASPNASSTPSAPGSTGSTGATGPQWQAPQWQGPQAAADPHPPKTRRRPLTGPIVWGALFLVACAYFTQRAFAPGAVDAAGWITATVIGLGVLLLVVGVAVVIRGGRER